MQDLSEMTPKKSKSKSKSKSKPKPNSRYGVVVKSHSLPGRGMAFKAYQKQCRELGIPELALRDPEVAREIGEKLVRELEEMEVALTKFEEEFPELHQQLPWYEAREAYKREKTEGRVKPPLWWEALAALHSARILARSDGFYAKNEWRHHLSRKQREGKKE
jgi:hypothetical protein